MGDFNVAQGVRLDTPVDGFDGSVAHSAAANTKGAWRQLIASTAFAWKGFALAVSSELSVSQTSALTDIGVGAAGSEQVIVPDFSTCATALGAETLKPVQHAVFIPIGVPAGSRVAARGQDGAGGGLNSMVAIAGIGGGWALTPVLGRVSSIGTSTATSRGTSVTTGVAAKGAYVQLTASTPHDARYLVVMPARFLNAVHHNIDIAIGGAGSETVIIPDLYAGLFGSLTPVYPVSIPAGSRLSARAKGGVNNTLDISVLLIG